MAVWRRLLDLGDGLREPQIGLVDLVAQHAEDAGIVGGDHPAEIALGDRRQALGEFHHRRLDGGGDGVETLGDLERRAGLVRQVELAAEFAASGLADHAGDLLLRRQIGGDIVPEQRMADDTAPSPPRI